MEQKIVQKETPVSVRKNLREDGLYRWDDVEVKEYRKVGDFFRDINKQVFFDDSHGFSCELRYFEVKPGGFSSFEFHDHVHGVMVLRGKGQVLGYSEQRGSFIDDIAEHDLVYVPSRTWHQFQAAEDEFLGFLCLVEIDRDRPRRPNEEEAAEIRKDPLIGEIVRL